MIICTCNNFPTSTKIERFLEQRWSSLALLARSSWNKGNISFHRLFRISKKLQRSKRKYGQETQRTCVRIRKDHFWKIFSEVHVFEKNKGRKFLGDKSANRCNLRRYCTRYWNLWYHDCFSWICRNWQIQSKNINNCLDVYPICMFLFFFEFRLRRRDFTSPQSSN